MVHESRAECGDQPTPEKRLGMLQWNLQTQLLLTLAVAIWIGFVCYQQQNSDLMRKIAPLQQMAAERLTEDPYRISIVRLPDTWNKEELWEVHLPEGQYRMYLATRGINPTGLAVAREEAPISSGRRRIELRRTEDEGVWSVAVFVDDQIVIQATETSDWNPDAGFVEHGGCSNLCEQVSPNKPVILVHRRFPQRQIGGTYSTSTENATNGLLLWIERVSPAGSR